ncbi:MAG: DUF4367 domain-containing protein [Eubacteriales bacterium]
MKMTNKQMERYADSLWEQMEIPENDAVPNHEFSDKFKANMEILSKQPKPKQKLWAKPLKVAAAVAMLTLTTAMAVHHEQIILVVKNVYTELTEYQFSAVPHDKELPTIKFGIMPEGMLLRVNEESDGTVYYKYVSETNEEFSLLVQNVSENTNITTIFDTENAEVTQVIVQDVDGFLIFKDNIASIQWVKENVVFYATSNLPSEEVLTIIEGLKIS